MSLVVFTNPGEIDPRSISTFGVSVKEGSNPIGFFGTGLKYAIAILLRTGHRVTILSGLRVLRFAVESQEIRGTTFGVVTMQTDDGAAVPMGFTTEVGKKWDVWMAYRELSCNCRDEGGSEEIIDYPPDAEAGVTKVLVDGEECAQAYQRRAEFILQDQPAFVVENVEVRRRPGQAFYYRGIRVHAFSRPAQFTYNNIGFMELTEDRTLKHQWEAESAVRRAIIASDDAEMIRTAVTSDGKTLEGGLDYHGWGEVPSPAFLKAVREEVRRDPTKVNRTAKQLVADADKEIFAPTAIVLTSVQQLSAQRAIDFCECLGFEVGAYPINYVESLGENVLGCARDNAIWIAERVFEIGGAKQLAATLIEEFVHLRFGYADCTRSMQNYLFEKMVSMGEEFIGDPL